MEICSIIENISTEISPVTLVAVSKTKPVELIEEAYKGGQRIFGENRVQELIQKQEVLPKDIEWHAIGHLQTNKVKYIAPFVSLIHAVDSFKLLAEINRQGERNQRIIPCLLQFHIADESTKHGFSINEVKEHFESIKLDDFQNIRISGVMGMATFTDNQEQIRSEFRTLKSIFKNLKETFFSQDDQFSEISMGMSGDYKIAIEEGSTMVRIGSTIFGSR